MGVREENNINISVAILCLSFFSAARPALDDHSGGPQCKIMYSSYLPNILINIMILLQPIIVTILI